MIFLDLSAVEQKGTDAFKLKNEFFNIADVVETAINIASFKLNSEMIYLASVISSNVPSIVRNQVLGLRE